MERQGKGSTTKKILFVSALQAELRVVREVFSPHPKCVQADFFVSGVGGIETTLRLTQKLSHSYYDFIINVGICGYRETKQDILQITRSVSLSTGKELLVPQFLKLAPRVSIACSDVPVYDASLLGEENYVDMESYAIEKVAEYFRIPRLILKVPYDKIGQETSDFNPSKAQAYLKNTLESLDIYTPLVKYLSSLTEKQDISSYLAYYPLTVSEKIIFEKYYYSYISLAKKDFKEFFNSYKQLEKKAFLRQLDKTCKELKKL